MGGATRADGLPAPGALLAGKYEVARVIGRGGMGVVVQARHLRMEKDVALKILLPSLRDQPEVVARFEREGRAAAQLHGVHVARVLDVDTLDDGLPFMVMELLQGEDLSEILRRRGPLPAQDAVGYVLEACSAMAEAHRVGIVHRDLKPNNLFVDRQGQRPVLKVLDFGISKVTSDASASMTATATAFGTPLYMSPEQVRSAKNVDGRADIWSLGVVLYELLTGIPPFAAESPTAILAAIIADTPVPVGDRRLDLPRPLADAVMRALEKSPAARFPDVQSFAAAIAPFGPEGDGAVTIAPRPSSPAAAPSLPPAVTASTSVPLSTAVPASPAAAWSFAPVAMGVLLAFAAGAFIFMAVRRRLPPPSVHVDSAVHAAPSTPPPEVAPAPSAVEPVTAAPAPSPPPVATQAPTAVPSSRSSAATRPGTTGPAPRTTASPSSTSKPAPRPEPSPERKNDPPPYL